MTIDPEKFEPQGFPTREQVRTVWDAHPKPSARVIAELLVNRGFSIGWRTVARWKESNWTEPPPKSVPLSEKGKARGIKKAIKAEVAKIPKETLAEVDKMVAAGGIEGAVTGGHLTDDDYTRIAKRIAALAPDSKEKLLEIQERSRLVMNIVMMEEATRRAHILVLIPKDAGSFMADSNEAANSVAGPAVTIENPGEFSPNGDNAKLIEGKVNPPSPLSMKLRQLREEKVA